MPLDDAVGRAVGLTPLGHVGEAEVGSLPLPPAVEMDEGGLAAADAEALFPPLPDLLARLGPPGGGRREVGGRQPGGPLRPVGGGILAPGGARPPAHIFAHEDEVGDAMGEELAGAGAALVARGGLAALDAEALVAPRLPEGLLVALMRLATAAQEALARAGGQADSGQAALGAEAFRTPDTARRRGGGRGRGGRGGSWPGGDFGQGGSGRLPLGGGGGGQWAASNQQE